MKLVIINHTFQKPEFAKRWRELAKSHEDTEITLLTPNEWAWGAEKNLTYGTTDVLHGTSENAGRFHIQTIDIKKNRLGEWTSQSMLDRILEIKPDVVYYIGGHTAPALIQILRMRKKQKLSDMRVIDFSMRGSSSSYAKIEWKSPKRLIRSFISKGYQSIKLYYFNRYCDATFCHYPDAVKAFRNDGYTRPIYMQTQVGVDPDVFYPSDDFRREIREKYNIGNAFLFGSASRFHYSKGLSEIIRALPQTGDWKYLLMGWGRDDEVEKIRDEIRKRGLQDKIILTGYIDNWTDMMKHWNALDCALHLPLTTPEWEETFSLALVQAMITGLPVIASSSGSVPYQVGPDGIVVPERDIPSLREKMEWMMQDEAARKNIGAKMRERAMNCFNIYHLNELFYRTVKDVVAGEYDESKTDMAKYDC